MPVWYLMYESITVTALSWFDVVNHVKEMALSQANSVLDRIMKVYSAATATSDNNDSDDEHRQPFIYSAIVMCVRARWFDVCASMCASTTAHVHWRPSKWANSGKKIIIRTKVWCVYAFEPPGWTLKPIVACCCALHTSIHYTRYVWCGVTNDAIAQPAPGHNVIYSLIQLVGWSNINIRMLLDIGGTRWWLLYCTFGRLLNWNWSGRILHFFLSLLKALSDGDGEQSTVFFVRQ